MTTPRPTRVLSVAGNALLWVTAALGAISLVLGLATIAAGVQPLIFRSSSMAPAIEAGALGLARTVDATDVKVDDIVSVTSTDGVRVTHRVVDIDAGEGDQVSLTLQGDTNPVPDDETYLVTEVDRVFFDIPYLGYLANWLASPWAMFIAGIVVALLIASLWNKRSRQSRDRVRPGVGAAAAAVVAAGLVATSLLPVPRTEAYFSDPSTFEAGVIQGHQVRIFDLAETNQCVQSGDNIVINAQVASPRYRMVWYRTSVGGAISGDPIKTVEPSGAPFDPVATTFTRADVSTDSGPYDLVGISQLKADATTPWRSAQERRVGVRTDAGGIRCGTTNLPPTLTFTFPSDGATYPSADWAEAQALVECLRRTPCGTALDSNGIYSVEYRLQRARLTTMCWDPTRLGILGYGYSCGTWHSADTIPSTPNTSGSPVTWRISEGIFSNAFEYNGSFTLYLRVTDNGTPRAVTERTIQFTVR